MSLLLLFHTSGEAVPVPDPPAARIFTVAMEDRTFEVAFEDRTFEVAFEDRTFEVE